MATGSAVLSSGANSAVRTIAMRIAAALTDGQLLNIWRSILRPRPARLSGGCTAVSNSAASFLRGCPT